MHIVFLGTGPSRAIPRKGHRDALCRDARSGGKSRRLRSSALITSGKTTILIDSGPDILKQLKQHKPKQIDAVLLTHGHEDAIDGLKDLDKWLRQQQIPVYTDRLTAQLLTHRFGKFKHLFFSKLKDYSPFKIKQVEVIPFPVLHTQDKRFKTYGYKFGSFCYASDFHELPKRTKTLLKGLNTTILDGAMYLGVKMPTHMSADATVRLASELKARQLILTQSGHTYPPHNQAELAIRRYAKANQLAFPKKIRLAFDGLELKN